MGIEPTMARGEFLELPLGVLLLDVSHVHAPSQERFALRHIVHHRLFCPGIAVNACSLFGWADCSQHNNLFSPKR